jgi:hypothetical protein
MPPTAKPPLRPLAAFVGAIFGALRAPWAWILGFVFALYPAVLVPWVGSVVRLEADPPAFEATDDEVVPSGEGVPNGEGGQQAGRTEPFLDDFRAGFRSGYGQESVDSEPSAARFRSWWEPRFGRGPLGAVLAPLGAANDHPALVGGGPQRAAFHYAALLVGALLSGLSMLALARWAYRREGGEHLGGRHLGELVREAWPAGALFGVAGLLLLLPVGLLHPLQWLALLTNPLQAPPAWLVSLALTVFVVAYGLLAGMVVQLGAHSLARNGRGVLSALQHAWRLLRARPWRAVRWALPAIVLTLLVHRIGPGLELDDTRALGLAPVFVLRAFAGAVTALYFARAFVALGGLATLGAVPMERPRDN